MPQSDPDPLTGMRDEFDDAPRAVAVSDLERVVALGVVAFGTAEVTQ